MTLEQRYRRLLRVFPGGWRRQHEDELVGTLLDAAEPGRQTIAPRDVLDLVRCALVLHARRARASGRVQVVLPASLAAAALGFALHLREIPVGFLLTSLVVAAIPGTGVFYTVSSAIGGGTRRGLWAAFGCTLGVIPHLLAAVLGLSGVMQVGASVFEVIRYAGVAYLVFMGVTMIRDRGGELLVGGERSSTEPTATIVRRGVLLNLLNPKLTLFFFAFLPQFLGSSSHPHLGRLFALGAVFMLVTFVVFAAYARASALLRERVLGAPVARRWFQSVLGTILIGIGVRLAVADR